MRFTFSITLCLAAATLVGCGSKTPTQSSQLKDSDDPDVVVSEEAKAQAIAAKNELFGKLSGRLMEVMQAEGPVKAIEVCSTEANEIASSVSEQLGVKIGRTSLKLRNPKNQPPEWAKKLFEKKPHEPQFANVSKGTTGALLPIKLQTKCLMCHGPVESLVPGVSEQLAKLYPDDQATGFQEGDLRGWFWVEVPSQTDQ